MNIKINQKKNSLIIKLIFFMVGICNNKNMKNTLSNSHNKFNFLKQLYQHKYIFVHVSGEKLFCSIGQK